MQVQVETYVDEGGKGSERSPESEMAM